MKRVLLSYSLCLIMQTERCVSMEAKNRVTGESIVEFRRRRIASIRHVFACECFILMKLFDIYMHHCGVALVCPCQTINSTGLPIYTSTEHITHLYGDNEPGQHLRHIRTKFSHFNHTHTCESAISLETNFYCMNAFVDVIDDQKQAQRLSKTSIGS